MLTHEINARLFLPFPNFATDRGVNPFRVAMKIEEKFAVCSSQSLQCWLTSLPCGFITFHLNKKTPAETQLLGQKNTHPRKWEKKCNDVLLFCGIIWGSTHIGCTQEEERKKLSPSNKCKKMGTPFLPFSCWVLCYMMHTNERISSVFWLSIAHVKTKRDWCASAELPLRQILQLSQNNVILCTKV